MLLRPPCCQSFNPYFPILDQDENIKVKSLGPHVLISRLTQPSSFCIDEDCTTTEFLWKCCLICFLYISPFMGAKVPPARLVQGAVPLQELDHKHRQRRHLSFGDDPNSPDRGFLSESDLPPSLSFSSWCSCTGRLVSINCKGWGRSRQCC